MHEWGIECTLARVDAIFVGFAGSAWAASLRILAGRGIGRACVSDAAMTAGRVVIIGGAFPSGVPDLLIDKIHRLLDPIEGAGIDPAEIGRGSSGPVAWAPGTDGTILDRVFLAEVGDEPGAGP